MFLDIAIKSFRQILSRPFRRVLLIMLAATFACLALIWFGLTHLFAYYLASRPLGEIPAYLETAAHLFASFGLVIGLVFLIPSVSALVAGFFLDQVAGLVEKEHYPMDPPGRDVPIMRSIGDGARFAGASLGVNLLALALILVPGVNLFAFLAANGYLLGRQYFEAAAARFHPPEDVRALRQRYRWSIFLAGLIVALLVSIPIVNLLTPLFGTTLLVHVHKRIQQWVYDREERPTAARPVGTL